MSSTNQRLGTGGNIALGDTVPIVLSLKRNGVAYSPTVSDAIALFKANITDADSAALISKTLADGIVVSGSTVTVTITPGDQVAFSATTTLHWAVRLLETNGADTTIADGTIQLTRLPVRNPL